MLILETEFLWHTLFLSLYFDMLLEEKDGPKKVFLYRGGQKIHVVSKVEKRK